MIKIDELKIELAKAEDRLRAWAESMARTLAWAEPLDKTRARANVKRIKAEIAELEQDDD